MMHASFMIPVAG